MRIAARHKGQRAAVKVQLDLAVPNLHASVQLGVRQQRNGVGDHAAIRMQLRVLKGIFYIGVTSAHTAVIPRNRCPKRRAALRAVRVAVVPSMLAVRAGGGRFVGQRRRGQQT